MDCPKISWVLFRTREIRISVEGVALSHFKTLCKIFHYPKAIHSRIWHRPSSIRSTPAPQCSFIFAIPNSAHWAHSDRWNTQYDRWMSLWSLCSQLGFPPKSHLLMILLISLSRCVECAFPPAPDIDIYIYMYVLINKNINILINIYIYIIYIYYILYILYIYIIYILYILYYILYILYIDSRWFLIVKHFGPRAAKAHTDLICVHMNRLKVKP